MANYYVHFNGAEWFVKTERFFIEQGGLEDSWGRAWRLIAADSIEHARDLAPKWYPFLVRKGNEPLKLGVYWWVFRKPVLIEDQDVPKYLGTVEAFAERQALVAATDKWGGMHLSVEDFFVVQK